MENISSVDEKDLNGTSEEESGSADSDSDSDSESSETDESKTRQKKSRRSVDNDKKHEQSKKRGMLRI